MPKSRVRSKAVYTPPPSKAKSKVSPRWLVPSMLGCLILGLAWIALYYITGGLITAAYAYAPRKNRTLFQVGATVLVIGVMVVAVLIRNHQILTG